MTQRIFLFCLLLFNSTTQSSGRFKRNYGMSFLNYLCLYRLTLATEQYTEARMLKGLAASVGFADCRYFSGSFRRYMGQSPAACFGRRTPV